MGVATTSAELGTTQRTDVGEFGTVALDRRTLEAALDRAEAGIRTVAARAGTTDANLTTNWHDLVGAAVTGAWRQAGPNRVTFDLAFLTVGDHAREIVGRVSEPTHPDAVVAQSMTADQPDAALATRLLRLAMASQRSGSTDLEGVLRLQQMGLVLTTDSRGPVLLREGGRIPLRWSGEMNPLTAKAPGMLRPAAGLGHDGGGLQ